MQIIKILTGNKQSGKTTALLNYCNNNKTVAGILTPIVNGKRIFYNIQAQEYFDIDFEYLPNDEALIVGKYKFSATAFAKANSILQNIKINKTTQVVIDEIGPLELLNKGFANTLKFKLKSDNINLLLVVRDGLVNEVIDFFKLQNVQIITQTNL